jgi:hypothetical protein
VPKRPPIRVSRAGDEQEAQSAHAADQVRVGEFARAPFGRRERIELEAPGKIMGQDTELLPHAVGAMLRKDALLRVSPPDTTSRSSSADMSIPGRRYDWAIPLFLAALITRLAYVLRFTDTLSVAGAEMLKVARSVAATGQYANPFGTLATGHTAHVAPGGTYILAAVLWLFPDERSAALVARLLAALAVALLVTTVYVFARRASLGERTARLAGLIALYPWSPFDELHGSWEAPYAALSLAVLSLLTVPPTTARPGVRQSVWIGLAFGVALLISPSALLFLAGIVLARLIRGRTAWIRALPRRALLAGVLTTALVLAPWTIRNRVVMGHWLFVRDNLGLELAVSNNDSAFLRAPWLSGIDVRVLVHPDAHRSEAQRIVDVGEVAYNREKLAEALAWVSQHPSRFAHFTLQRAGYFWLPPSGSLARLVVDLFVLGAALIGLVLTLVRRIPAPTEVACGALAYSSLYSLVQADSRYQYPIHWVVCLLAAIAFSAFVGWRRQAR